jgi:hypothetical protein
MESWVKKLLLIYNLCCTTPILGDAMASKDSKGPPTSKPPTTTVRTSREAYAALTELTRNRPSHEKIALKPVDAFNIHRLAIETGFGEGTYLGTEAIARTLLTDLSEVNATPTDEYPTLVETIKNIREDSQRNLKTEVLGMVRNLTDEQRECLKTSVAKLTATPKREVDDRCVAMALASKYYIDILTELPREEQQKLVEISKMHDAMAELERAEVTRILNAASKQYENTLCGAYKMGNCGAPHNASTKTELSSNSG